MPIRTILAPVDGSEASKSAMDMAFALGRDLPAHVDVLHVRPDPKDAVPLLGEGMSGAMIEEMIELAEKESGQHAQSARGMFEAACKDQNIPLAEMPDPAAGVTAGWIEITGREDEITACRGRLADLIVVARPVADSEVSTTLTINAALFESGRPVLIAPPGPPRSLTGTAVVAWNGSAEAARSVAAAGPLLRRFDKVLIVTSGEGEAGVPSGDRLSQYLAWHGVASDVTTISDGRGAGSEILAACAGCDANLLVMGAYTHSRLRQLILGGVTSHMLAEATIPVLMSH
ncbi:MAG: universal stress protein [Rhodobacterales bacterium]|nr:universal stress protein [Rhodobacterales bacterium]